MVTDQPNSTISPASQETKTIVGNGEKSDETGNESLDDLSNSFVHLSPLPNSPPHTVDASINFGPPTERPRIDDFCLDDG